LLREKLKKEEILGAESVDFGGASGAYYRVFWPVTVLFALFGVGWTLMPAAVPAPIQPGTWRIGPVANPFAHVTMAREEPAQTEISIFKRNQVRVPGAARVLGVLVDGQPRAYLADGMARPEWHLAHDALGGRDVTVSYCNWTQCARVFDRQETDPAAIRMGGFRLGQMQVVVDEVAYDQNSESVPLRDVPVVQMAWDEWQALHPSTDIFLGDKAAEFALPHATGERLD